jgi:ABC-type Mn2+/Zn2+ transport system permease subunit
VVLGWAVGLIACLSGLIASYNFNLPYGPTLVLFLGLFFLAAIIIRSVRGRAVVEGRS